MPFETRIGRGIDDLGNALTEAYRISRERERQAAENLRAKQAQETAQRYAAVQEGQLEMARASQERLAQQELRQGLADAMKIKNPIQRAAILQGLGWQMTGSEDVFEPNPDSKPQGGSPVPDGVEFGGMSVQDDRDITQMYMQQNPAVAAARDRNQMLAENLKRAGRPPGDQPLPMSPGVDPAQRLVGKRMMFRHAGGQEYVMDPLEERRAREAENERLAEQSRDAFGDQGADYAELATGLARMGVPEVKVAEIITGMIRDDQREAARVEAEKRADKRYIDRHGTKEWRQGRVDRRSPFASTPNRPEIDATKGLLAIESAYSGEVQKVLTNFGFKDLNTQAVKFDDMLEQIAGAGDNAALAAVARGTFVKFAQGGVGVISDSDMRVFWGQIGGLGLRTSEAFRAAVDGKLGPEKQAQVKAAVQEMYAKAQNNINNIGGRLQSRLSGMERRLQAAGVRAESRIPEFLETYAPGYTEKARAEQQRGETEGRLKARGF